MDVTRIEHKWELVKNCASNTGRTWICSNCGAVVQPNSTQIKWNFLRKPNKKRKFDGMRCGELIVKAIHDS